MPNKRLNMVLFLFAALLAATSLQAQAATSTKTHASAHHVVAKPHATARKHVVAKKHVPAGKHVSSKTRHAPATHHMADGVAAAADASSDGIAARVLEGQPAWLPISLRFGPVVEHGAAQPLGASAPLFSPVAAAAVATVSPWIARPAVDDGTAGDDGVETVHDLRQALISLAMSLRDTRYARGGRTPSTGFDCSGFVRYVFAHAIGMKLPTSSASQFLAGLKVNRDNIKPGDLVFFRTGGKRGNISHVGIYLSNGRFIHSPASGKTVQVSSLSEAYWAKHFAGAKRPAGIAAVATNG